MILTLPTFEDPFYSYAVSLEGRSYLLSFRYNQREECWYLTIAMSDGTVLLAGIKVLVGVNLLWRRADNRLPPGQLYAFVTGNNTEHPGLTDFGDTKRVALGYVTSDDES